MIARRAVLIAGFAVLAGDAARAVRPGEQLADPALEARARRLSGELRCLVCQNQSIDDSDAELARDLRRLVRERIAAGDSDASVRSFLVARYGEFVLLRPPLSWNTALLWSLPALALLGGAVLARGLFRARNASGADTAAPTVPLSADETARLDALIERARRDG